MFPRFQSISIPNYFRKRKPGFEGPAFGGGGPSQRPSSKPKPGPTRDRFKDEQRFVEDRPINQHRPGSSRDRFKEEKKFMEEQRYMEDRPIKQHRPSRYDNYDIN